MILDSYWASDFGHGRGRAPRRRLMDGLRVIPQVIGGGDWLEGVDVQPWLDEAICGGVDPELFFPDPGRYDTSRAARRICARCPVMQDCREYGVAHPELMGVWGGETETTRQRIRGAA